MPHNTNNNDGFDSNDLTPDMIEKAQEIASDPFNHPDSPVRFDVNPADLKSVCAAALQANAWLVMNFMCFEHVMQEVQKDLPPYLSRRVSAAMQKMTTVVRQSGEAVLKVGHQVADTE